MLLLLRLVTARRGDCSICCSDAFASLQVTGAATLPDEESRYEATRRAWLLRSAAVFIGSPQVTPAHLRGRDGLRRASACFTSSEPRLGRAPLAVLLNVSPRATLPCCRSPSRTWQRDRTAERLLLRYGLL